MYDDFPEGYKSLVSYILKFEPVEVTHNNWDSILLCREISENPIQDLRAITENISDK